MNKEQALLETLLGAAELCGNQALANQIRGDLSKMNRPPVGNGYERLSRAATEPKCALRKAA